MPNPPKPQGVSKEAYFMQWIWEQLTGWLQPLDSPTVAITRTTRGWYATVKQVSGGTSTPTTLDPFIISDIRGDYLICTPRGGAATVNVAKSPCLWQSVTTATIESVVITYDVAPYVGKVGQYVRRDAIIAGVRIKEEVTPPYLVGQQIYAMKVTGGTGATAPAGSTVDYVSMADPRAWATRADQST